MAKASIWVNPMEELHNVLQSEGGLNNKAHGTITCIDSGPDPWDLKRAWRGLELQEWSSIKSLWNHMYSVTFYGHNAEGRIPMFVMYLDPLTSEEDIKRIAHAHMIVLNTKREGSKTTPIPNRAPLLGKFNLK